MDENDVYVELVEDAVQRSTRTGAFGTTFIDICPPCKFYIISPFDISTDVLIPVRYLPAWMPGMGLKRFALKTKELVDTLISDPVDELKAKRVRYIEGDN